MGAFDVFLIVLRLKFWSLTFFFVILCPIIRKPTMQLNRNYILLLFLAFALAGRADNLGFTDENPLKFSMDLDYKDRQAMREDYSNTGWDKGHMAPAADMKWSQSAMNESFYLTNICPQNHDLNGKDWHTLEKYVRDWALKYGRVWVVCGPYFYANNYGTIGNQNVAVPDGFFKAVLRYDGEKYHSIAFVFENNDRKQSVWDAVVSVNDVEALTGYDLFTNLSNQLEEEVESQCNWNDWKLR